MALSKPRDSAPSSPSSPSAPALPGLTDLLAQLASADIAARRASARGLAAHPAAAPELAGRLEQEADPGVRTALFNSLASIGSEAAASALLPLLRSQDPALRNGAIEVLAGLPGAVVPRIESLLADDDSDVRIFAVNLLGQLPHADVPRWLAQVLRDEPETNVVGAALDVAAEVAGPEMAADLLAARQRFPADPFIAFAADLVLRRIGAA